MDYHLKPIGKTCASTGKELVPGSTCHCIVMQRSDELTRLDFSEEGWPGLPKGAIGHWRCVVPEPAETKGTPIDPDALLRYFEQLTEDNNPTQEKFRFVLSLLLLQKRRLRVEDSTEKDGEEFLELIGSQGEGPFYVKSQQLADVEITELQNSLNEHLATEWS